MSEMERISTILPRVIKDISAPVKSVSEVFQMDCLLYMKTVPDKFFNLSIVDPPYGINADGVAFKNGLNCVANGFKSHKKSNWDFKIPTKEYFKELFRVSKNQIITGANYFVEHLPPTMAWVFWYKMQDNFSFSDGEMIFTSFQTKTKIFKYARGNESGFSPMGNSAPNIHPTQKPVALYKWLLKNYAKEGDKIFDSHLGSQSSRIACYDMGFDFYGCELDEDYFKAGCERYENHIKQGRLFHG